jgi:serine/threonine protein kinase
MEIQISVTAGAAKGSVFSFEQPDCFLFGRSEDAKVSLAHDGHVSRQHFLLTIAPPDCRVIDLGSKNGTIVNGRRYGGRKPVGPGIVQAPDGEVAVTLRHGDEIVVGDTRMTVAINTDAVCAQCRDAIHHRDKPECAAGGGFVCRNCRARTHDQARPPAETLSMFYALACARCGSDVTSEAGNAGQVLGAEFVCGRCRAQVLAPAPHQVPVTELPSAPPGAPAIAGYTLLAELGRGGMGAVYKARHDATGALVAIKTMLPHVAINSAHVQMFEREVEVTRQLRHANIVELRGHGKVDGTIYCVLEFVEGVDLAKLIERRGGKLALQEAAGLMLQILAGLGHAHGATLSVELPGGARSVAGIVHRDLKPQNILLAAQAGGWIPKVADFGLSKAFESAGMSSFTTEGQVAGTPVYWPREQITQYRYLHPATDVFSIAAVFYEALTGSLVRDSFAELTRRCRERGTPPNLGDFAIAILDSPIVPIRTRDPSIPINIAAVLDRALAEAEVPGDPGKMRDMLSRLRYPDATAFRHALLAALRQDCPQWVFA